MRINDLSSLSLIEYHYLHKSHLFVPLSVYDVMTALLLRASCFPSTSSATWGIDSHKDCLSGYGGNTKCGDSSGAEFTWLAAYLIRKREELGCIWTVGGCLQDTRFACFLSFAR
jgi:hypothetical protein